MADERGERGGDRGRTRAKGMNDEDREAVCAALVKSFTDTSFTALQASVVLSVSALEALVILQELWQIGCCRCQGGAENNCFRMSPEEVNTA